MTIQSSTSSSSSSSNNATSTFITAASAVAAVTAVSLWAMQTDLASRFLLSSKSLQRKRVQEYVYRWDWTLTKTLLRKVRVGHDQQMDRVITEVVFQQDDIKHFIQSKLLSNENSQDVSILHHLWIEPDDEDGEYYVSTALCFIADASSGLGTSLLSTVLTESKAGVVVIEEPLWMALFANLVEKALIGIDKMKRILFGLCRLEAWNVRHQLGSARTVVFTLPGQACTPILVPLLQAVFPCERHVFAYDGCISSVNRALVWRKHGGDLHNNNKKNLTAATTTSSSSNDDNDHSSVTTTLPFHNAITATTPMSRVSLTASIRPLADKLAKLPLQLADTTEAWMSSVDAFLQMKENEASNDYLPYVLKLSLLVSNEPLDSPNSIRRLALTNVLQFVTGSRSRPIPDGVVDAAVESLRDYVGNLRPESLANNMTSSKQCTLIEDCVFQHKLILIENKTLKDTVMPRKDWSLKAAKRMVGCACCAPEEGEGEEELSNVAKKEANRKRPKFVDGKTAFAFDPTQFQ